MSREIHRVGVLGAGVMGSAIAAHFVNAGIDVVLLDLEIEKNGAKIRLADAAVKAMRKAKPSPIFVSDWLNRIETGVFGDDFAKLGDCDWVIEVVKEDLAIKHDLYEKVVPHLKQGVILTTNTSGIPIVDLVKGLPAEMAANFCGTHFFNPPRYMKLLEVIPGPETDPELLEFMRSFGESRLGKGVVFAKDCPNFIANRIGVLAMMGVMRTMLDDGYTIEEVDVLMGPLTGRPKSAVFKTADIVGLDTFAHVADNLHAAVPDDECRAFFELPHPVRAMIEKGHLGRKSGSGFYKKDKDGIKTIDLDTLSYRERKKAKFASVDMLKNVEDLHERLRKLIALDDRAGTFVWKTLSTVLVYAVKRIGEVADDIVNIDRAMRWGFNWKMGPFETWDAIGVRGVADRLAKEGRDVPKLIETMLEKGIDRFYQEDGPTSMYLDVESLEYREIPARPNVLILKNFKKDASRIVKHAPGASLLDLGDGVACLEFHSKMNAIGSDTISMTQYAVKTVEESFDALVVANQGGNFSAGANLMLLLLEAQEGNFEDINMMIAAFQKATTSLRYCSKPVVVAPHGLTLGGGCEFTLHGDGVEAAAESYIGLVEVGVGLIPAGGGTKEMLLRHVGGAQKRGEKDLLTPLRQIFETIGMGKVATSAYEARDMGFLRDGDGVTINGDALVVAAKKRARAMADMGYNPPEVPNDIPVLGEPAFAALKLGLFMMREGGYISEHDQKIGTHLARILTGGSLTPGTTMSEEHVLELEREAFLRLCGERKSLERVQHMLTKGKPLRN